MKKLFPKLTFVTFLKGIGNLTVLVFLGFLAVTILALLAAYGVMVFNTIYGWLS
jgi:hypothetical protein